MQLITPPMEIPEVPKSIFLAGPINRDPGPDAPHWQNDAIALFEDKGYDGVILSPCNIRCKEDGFDYAEQIQWEHKGIERASIVLFWIPRTLDTLPGFTTNVEFGLCLGGWKSIEQVVYGRPADAVKCRYLDELYKLVEVATPSPLPSCPLSIEETLEGTIQAAINALEIGYPLGRDSSYYMNRAGQCHNHSGPAVVWEDGQQFYYLYDKQVNLEEWEQKRRK